jgi:hypothetical protein
MDLPEPNRLIFWCINNKEMKRENDVFSNNNVLQNKFSS